MYEEQDLKNNKELVELDKRLEEADKALQRVREVEAAAEMSKAKELVNAATKLPKANWTVMVYLAGDNNLADEMVYALKCMFSVGETDRCRVFALYDFGLKPVTFEVQPHKAVKVQPAEVLGKVHQVTPALRTIGPVVENHGLLRLAEDIRRGVLDSKGRPLKAPPDAGKAPQAPPPASPLPVQLALEKFIQDSVLAAPAHRYMLVLSGHGTGNVGDFLASRKRADGLTIPDLSATLGNVESYFASAGGGQLYDRMHILGLDSCQMSTSEVAYQVRDYVDFLVGAEGFEPNTGWPYDQILENLNAQATVESGPVPDAMTLAESIVKKSINFYGSDYALADDSTDMAALNLRQMDGLATLLGNEDGLVKLMREAVKRKSENEPAYREVFDAIVLAHWEAQAFRDEQNADIWDFCECLRLRCEKIPAASGKFPTEVAAACRAVQNAINKEGNANNLVVLSGYCGPMFQHAHGLSVYFPWSRFTDAAGVEDLAHYATLDFAQDTQWDEFLKEYLDATQRQPREGARPEHESTLNRRDWLFVGTPTPEVEIVDGEVVGEDEDIPIHEGKIIIHKGVLNIKGDEQDIKDGRVTVKDGRVTVKNGSVTLNVKDGRVTVKDKEIPVTGDDLIEVKDGRVTVKDGRVTVKDGRVTVKGGGSLEVRDGRVTVKDGSNDVDLDVRDGGVSGGELGVRDGRVTVKDGRVTVKDGRVTVKGLGAFTVRDGRVTVKDGRVTVKDGRVTVKDGRVTVKAGSLSEVRAGGFVDGSGDSLEVRDGRVTVKDGRVTVKDGRVTVKGGGLGMITKIASMKNPPVLWPDSEVMVVERAMTQNKE